MYHTGVDPLTDEPVYTATDLREKRMMKALIFWWDEASWPLAREALKKAGRADLIGRGPRCIDPRRILGAAHLSQDSVDLIFRDNTRVRARLEGRCPALDFYRGFYVPMSADGQICADRDSIRSRTGGECQIERFRTLTAEAAR